MNCHFIFLFSTFFIKDVTHTLTILDLLEDSSHDKLDELIGVQHHVHAQPVDIVFCGRQFSEHVAHCACCVEQKLTFLF